MANSRWCSRKNQAATCLRALLRALRNCECVSPMRESAGSELRNSSQLAEFGARMRSLAHFHGAPVRDESLGVGQGRHHGAKAAQTGRGDVLHAGAAHKIRRGKPAASSGAPVGGKHVIGAAGVIANRLRAPGSEKRASGSLQFVRELRLRARNTEMFGRETVGESHCGGRIRREKDGAFFLEGSLRRIRIRQTAELFG